MTPERFRTLVSLVLLVGVVVSAALIAVSLLGALVVGWDGSLVASPPAGTDPTDFSGVFVGLVALRPIALAQAGLLTLLATPVLRIVASVVAFALEGDRLYTGITFAVLMILLVSLFLVR
jgi:uncharacterized membrane protein